MTELEEAAQEHRDLGKDTSERIVSSWTNTDCVEDLQEKAFVAGALWLLGRAKKITIAHDAVYWDGMNLLIKTLEQLCEGENER